MATASQMYGQDVAFVDGDITIGIDGDMTMAVGRACLAQDLGVLLRSNPGCLQADVNAGVGLSRWINESNTALNCVGLVNQITETLTDDPRVIDCAASVTSWTLDGIVVRIQVVPIDERSPLNLTVTITASGTEVTSGL